MKLKFLYLNQEPGRKPIAYLEEFEETEEEFKKVESYRRLEDNSGFTRFGNWIKGKWDKDEDR